MPEVTLPLPELFQDPNTKDWRVEYIMPDGSIQVSTFSGPQAEERAVHFANVSYVCYIRRKVGHMQMPGLVAVPAPTPAPTTPASAGSGSNNTQHPWWGGKAPP